MNNPEYLIIFFVISIVIYFLLREVNAWYWKINEIIRILNDQNVLLEKISNKSSVDTPGKISGFVLNVNLKIPIRHLNAVIAIIRWNN